MALRDTDLFIVQRDSQSYKMPFSELSTGVALTLQQVTDNGNTTTNGATFGGAVGIGTDSPDRSLHIEGASVPVLINSSNGNATKIEFQDNGTSRGYIGARNGASLVGADSTGTENFRIEEDGTILVTGGGSSDVPIKLNADGSASFAGEILLDKRLRIQGTGAQSVIDNDSDNLSFKTYSAAVGNFAERFRIDAGNTVKVAVRSEVDPTKDAIIFNGDGSADFAGNVLVGGDANLGQEIGCRINSVGIYQATRNGNQPVFIAYEGVTKDPTIELFATGRASFSGTVNSSENSIVTGTAPDFTKGNFWVCAGGFTILSPHAVSDKASGLIRLTGAPTGWSTNYKFPGGAPPEIANFPAVIPYYVQDQDTILMGNAVEGMA